MASRYLVANWKMNLPPEGIAPYLSAVSAAQSTDVGIVVAPPFPYLREVSSQPALAVAAQNCADREKGAFTGEVSAGMIRDRGARFVLIGHSERRTIYGESDVIVARKLAVALAAGLVPILCVGEDLRTRDSGQVATFLAGQIRAAAEAGLDSAGEIVLAYEPVWAIGTGRSASGGLCADSVAHIRDALGRFWPRRLAGIPVLYGGSVTPDNIADLETNGRIDGYLCGGASLESGRFLGILRGMQRSA
ncbi:MAG TPA: triose-phosphate isomerase [Thermoanaerobaculia bacterium]